MFDRSSSRFLPAITQSCALLSRRNTDSPDTQYSQYRGILKPANRASLPSHPWASECSLTSMRKQFPFSLSGLVSIRSAGHEKPRELRYPQRVNELYKTTGRPPTDYRFMLLKDFRRCKRVPNPKFSMLLLRINYAVHCCCGFCLNGAFSGLIAIPFATRTSSQKGFCVTGY